MHPKVQPPRSLSVVIPTYQRPEWIKRAVHSLARQTRLPDEVIPVMRDTDTATHVAVGELEAESLPFPIRRGVVSEPGFMPPVYEGFQLAGGDVIAVLDDDAEALEDWCERLLGHYGDPNVGAVGGRYINMLGEGQLQDVGTTRRVGYLTLFGKLVGDMYKDPTFDSPMDVSFLMGGCMSYRREVARRLEFDWELNRVVATHYEVDLGLQVRRMGCRVIFDPKVKIRHYTAPRSVVGNRKVGDVDAVRWNAFNEMRIVVRRCAAWRGAIHVSRGLVIGVRQAPGFLPWVLGPLSRRAGFVTAAARPAILGRLHALATLRRSRPAPR